MNVYTVVPRICLNSCSGVDSPARSHDEFVKIPYFDATFWVIN
jgi:hypothetical protein